MDAYVHLFINKNFYFEGYKLINVIQINFFTPYFYFKSYRAELHPILQSTILHLHNNICSLDPA